MRSLPHGTCVARADWLLAGTAARCQSLHGLLPLPPFGPIPSREHLVVVFPYPTWATGALLPGRSGLQVPTEQSGRRGVGRPPHSSQWEAGLSLLERASKTQPSPLSAGKLFIWPGPSVVHRALPPVASPNLPAVSEVPLPTYTAFGPVAAPSRTHDTIRRGSGAGRSSQWSMGHPVHVSSRQNRGRFGSRPRPSGLSGTEPTLLLLPATPGPRAPTSVLTAPDSLSIFLYALQKRGGKEQKPKV